MSEKKKSRPKAPARGRKQPGFWDRSEPSPGIVSVRNPSSRLARTAAFLLRLLGLGRKNG
jgi:hypothetical protein